MKLSISSKPSSCDCGCQEEIKALTLRCKHAEGQIALKEMQCERAAVRLKSYKDKWTHWKEVVVREQYQRRMGTPMTPEIARSAPPGSSQKRQQGQNGNQTWSQTTDQSHEGVKRTRFLTDESETSQERRETTMRNTFFNRFSAGNPDDHGRPESLALSTSDRHAGIGSVNEPHVIFDDRDGISGLDNGGTDPKGHQEQPPTVDYEGNDASAEYPLSPTFPSEFALHRRQYLSDDDGEDEEEAAGYESSNGTPRKFYAPTDASPAARASEIRNQKRISMSSNHRSTHDQSKQQPSEMDFAEIGDPPSIRSDGSSPPMFDFDLQTPFPGLFELGGAPNISREDRRTGESPHATRQKVARSGVSAPAGTRNMRSGLPKEVEMIFVPASKSARMASRGEPSTTRDLTNSVSHDQRYNSVPATPPDQQGIMPMEHVFQRKPQSSGFGSPSEVGVGQGATDQKSLLRIPKAEIITLDDDEGAPSQVQPVDEIDVDELNKENRTPPEDPLHETRAHSSESAQRAHRPAVDPNIPEQRIYNYTERRKDKRRQMHGHDCACCRRFYELTGPLPLPDGYNAFFTPAPRPGEKADSEKTPEERLQERIQQISRHRVHHEAPLTPPGFWDTDFPPTPDRVAWDRIAEERRDRKKQRTEHDQRQQQQQQQYPGGRI